MAKKLKSITETNSNLIADPLFNIYDSMPIGIFVLDMTGSIIYQNPEAIRIWDKKEADKSANYCNFPKWSLTDNKPLKTDDCLIKSVINKGVSIINNELEIESFNGIKKIILESAIPLKNSDAVVYRILVINNDISEKKRIERELSDTKSICNILFNNITDIIYTADMDLNYTFLSPSFEKMRGIKIEKMLGKSILDHMSPESANKIVEEFNKNLKLFHDGKIDKDTVTTLQLQFKITETDFVWIETTSNFILNNKGKPVGIIGISRDISDRKKIEEDLIKSKEKAVTANLAKSQFLATMSHEIRTPMCVIMGYLDLLKQSDTSLVSDSLYNNVREAGQALLDILNDTLEYSKIDLHKIEFENNCFSLSKFLENLIILEKPKIINPHMNFYFKIHKDVPDSIITDIKYLKIILVNLITNAIKFTSKGEIIIFVKRIKESDKKNIWLEFSVRDTGIGIPEDLQEFIFDLFSQIDSSLTRKYSGVGLGLTLVKAIIKKMKGNIRVESTEGKGSNFIFIIPVHSSETLAPEEPQIININPEEVTESIRTINDDFDYSKLKVLIAEDNELSQRFIKTLLNSINVKFDIASNGKEAVEKALNNKFDIIFMDILMPVMGGVEACRELHAKHKISTPIIALTALSIRGDKEKLLAQGLDDYMAKPIEMEKLKVMLKKWSS